MPYTLEVDHEFCAAHSLAIAGSTEPVHGHNFRVTARVTASDLDADGLVADFHTVHAKLVEVCEPFTNRDMNGVEPFHRVNPSAEHIARHIADALAALLDGHLAPTARVGSVTVTEAPGCRATFER